VSRGRTKTDIEPAPGKWVPKPGDRVRSSFEANPGTVSSTFNQHGQDQAVVTFGRKYSREVYLSQLMPVTT
jgi:hypothetical protein